MNAPGEQNFPARKRPSAVSVAACLVMIAGLGALAVFVLRPSDRQPIAQTEPSEDPVPSAPPTRDGRSGTAVATPEKTGTAPMGSARSTGAPTLVEPTAPLSVPLPAPTPQTRQLVDALCKLDPAASPINPERAAAWKQNFQQLVQSGSAAVPAIAEFLKQNRDFTFEGEAGRSLGYGSARTAMLDALTQIGGPESIDVLTATLQVTADPREVALLAQSLEKLEPVKHRQEALEAARQTLAFAGEGKLPDRDVAPLFEVLQKYGQASEVQDLQKASGQWNYYAAIALAQLPDGAGIPALIQMAQGGTVANTTALEVVAQSAAQYPEARAALLDMARANKIMPSQWAYLTSLLAGEQFHYQGAAFEVSGKSPEGAAYIVYGNQHYFTALPEGGLTPEQVGQRTALIDELLAITSEPAAVNALQQSKDLLAKSQPQTAAVPGK